MRSLLRPIAALPLLLVTALLHAQIPTKCLEIESILVDACVPGTGCSSSSAPACNCEGKNEMVRFITGPAPVALSDISIDWYASNQPFQGLVQNATTAALTATLNASIESCGWLVEPPGGIIPAGRRVLLITSTDLCTDANSFAALADTLYLVFQNPGNFNGHFKNTELSTEPSPVPLGSGGTRWMRMYVGPGTACGDTATYDYYLLVNELGTYGGDSDLNDGAGVEYSWPGVPQATYVNNGCQAPIIPFHVEAEVEGALCDGGTVQLNGLITGSYSSLIWSGGTGTFDDPTDLSTTYTAGPGESGTVELQLCATGVCTDPVCTTVMVPAGEGPAVFVTADGPLTICSGEELVLTADGAEEYVWNTSEVTASIAVDAPGTYTVTGSNACGEATASVTVVASPGPDVEIIPGGPAVLCDGASLTLTATGANDLVWSTTETTPSITITTPGTYSVTASNACGTATASILVFQGEGPVALITGDLQLCPGESTVLTATGGPGYAWSTGASTAAITVNGPGTYAVTVDNGCGTATASVTVTQVTLSAAFTASPQQGEAPLEVEFTPAVSPSGSAHDWDFGDGASSSASAPEHTFTDPGVYTVVHEVSGLGCTVSSTLTVVVVREVIESWIEVPNVFTPNGDSENPRLQVTAVNITSLDMEVYNRWGQLVGNLGSVRDSWDGRADGSGEPVPEGTYFYTLRAVGGDGKTHDRQGTVTVLR